MSYSYLACVVGWQGITDTRWLVVAVEDAEGMWMAELRSVL